MSPVSFQQHGLKGLDRVMYRLNRQIAATRVACLKGLIRAAILIRRDMDKTPPLVPVDTGNLRSSWFMDPRGDIGAGKVFIRIGFSANYATFVHEMIGAHFKRPGAGPKFFQAAIRRNTGKIVSLIRNTAKMP